MIINEASSTGEPQIVIAVNRPIDEIIGLPSIQASNSAGATWMNPIDVDMIDAFNFSLFFPVVLAPTDLIRLTTDNGHIRFQMGESFAVPQAIPIT